MFLRTIKGEFMKKVVLKRQLLSFVVSMCACFASANAAAETSIANENSSSLKDSDCSKDLLLAYFPESFVKETFTKFNVPKDKWSALIKGLNDKDKEVIRVVEDKASKMTPNPLKDPQQRQLAVKLFRETLLEIFSNVMKANGVTDDTQISSMLDDIQQQKAKRIAMCIKKDSDANKSDSDDLDDDDDDDDYDDDDDDDDDDLDDEDEEDLKNSGNQKVKPS